MTIEDAWNRGNNLVSIAVVALAGFAFAPELILEPEWQFKVDDILLLVLGIGAIAWYKKNSFRRTIVPVLFVLVGLIIKVCAIVIEIKDKEDVGDDFGGLVLFICATVFVLYLHFRRQPKAIS